MWDSSISDLGIRHSPTIVAPNFEAPLSWHAAQVSIPPGQALQSPLSHFWRRTSSPEGSLKSNERPKDTSHLAADSPASLNPSAPQPGRGGSAAPARPRPLSSSAQQQRLQAQAGPAPAGPTPGLSRAQAWAQSQPQQGSIPAPAGPTPGLGWSGSTAVHLQPLPPQAGGTVPRLALCGPWGTGGSTSDLWFSNVWEDTKAGAGTWCFKFQNMPSFLGLLILKHAVTCSAGRAVRCLHCYDACPDFKSTLQKVKILTSLHQIKTQFTLSNVFLCGKTNNSTSVINMQNKKEWNLMWTYSYSTFSLSTALNLVLESNFLIILWANLIPQLNILKRTTEILMSCYCAVYSIKWSFGYLIMTDVLTFMESSPFTSTVT